MEHRVDVINTLYNKHQRSARQQNVIVLHLDSRSNSSQIDIFYYYYPGSQSGRNLTEILYQMIKTKYAENQPGRGYRGTVQSRELYILGKTLPTAIYIELGNIRNRRDQDRFILENNRQAVANWLCEGLIEAAKK